MCGDFPVSDPIAGTGGRGAAAFCSENKLVKAFPISALAPAPKIAGVAGDAAGGSARNPPPGDSFAGCFFDSTGLPNIGGSGLAVSGEKNFWPKKPSLLASVTLADGCTTGVVSADGEKPKLFPDCGTDAAGTCGSAGAADAKENGLEGAAGGGGNGLAEPGLPSALGGAGNEKGEAVGGSEGLGTAAVNDASGCEAATLNGDG